MPELPEVETMRRGILAVAGAKVLKVSTFDIAFKPLKIEPSLDELRERIVGRSIASVDRLGKRVVLRFDHDERLIFEPRMTGLVLLSEAPDEEHLRLRLVLDGAAPRLDFWDRRGLGVIRLLTAERFATELGESKLGPDALTISAETLRHRFAASRRPIKVALLDQRALAGVGNLYASEILHVAGVHPATPCHRLKAAQWNRIHAAMIAILEEAIRCEGSTLSDGTYRNALNKAGGYQSRHRVYDRAGQACGACQSTAIVRIIQAQRSTFFCPKCQRKGTPRVGTARRKR